MYPRMRYKNYIRARFKKGISNMKMQKRKFRIGDLAKRLHIDKFVIRFWEKEFKLNTIRSEGGQRFYEEKDYETFKHIKILLYDKKFTIAGAKKEIEKLDKNTKIIASHKTSLEPPMPNKNMLKKLIRLKKNLVKLKKLLQ